MSELEEYRKRIDEIDRELVALWQARTTCTDAVGRYKLAHGLPVLDREREAAVLEEKQALVTDPGLKEDVLRLYETIFALSRQRQHALMEQAGLSTERAEYDAEETAP